MNDWDIDGPTTKNGLIYTIKALRAENAKLKSALKPFADKANKAEEPFAPPYPEDYPLWRAARTAIREEGESNG